MSRHTLRIAVAGTLLGLGLVTTGCAEKMAAKKATPEETVAQRQRLMKLHGALWKDIQDKHKAGLLEAMAVDAEALAYNARYIPSLFPEGSMTEKSKAKPEVWQKWPEFQAAALTLEKESEKLRDAANKKDKVAIDNQMKDFGRNACGSCHTPFRVPPPRQG